MLSQERKKLNCLYFFYPYLFAPYSILVRLLKITPFLYMVPYRLPHLHTLIKVKRQYYPSPCKILAYALTNHILGQTNRDRGRMSLTIVANSKHYEKIKHAEVNCDFISG